MTQALIQRAAEIRQNAAALRERAERLLSDLREMTDDITIPPKAEEYNIPKKHGRRIILELR